MESQAICKQSACPAELLRAGVMVTPRAGVNRKRPAGVPEGMIPKSGYRFSDKIMLKQKKSRLSSAAKWKTPPKRGFQTNASFELRES